MSNETDDEMLARLIDAAEQVDVAASNMGMADVDLTSDIACLGELVYSLGSRVEQLEEEKRVLEEKLRVMEEKLA